MARYLTLFLILSFGFSACNLNRFPNALQTPVALPTTPALNAPTATSPGVQVLPSSTPPPVFTLTKDATQNWVTLLPGLEQRIYTPEDNAFVSYLVLRIDPDLFSFRAHYMPGELLNLRDWQAQLPGAVAFINANFFDRDNLITGMIISDGVRYGISYRDRGGTFLIQNGVPRVRSNIYEPYQGEYLEQAVQAFPMLVLNGVQSFTTRSFDLSRRTVIGQDVQGRILMLVTVSGAVSLSVLSAYLPTTDMNLVNAFNLDGGGSTMMYIQPVEREFFSFDPVPAVLAVYSK